MTESLEQMVLRIAREVGLPVAMCGGNPTETQVIKFARRLLAEQQKQEPGFPHCAVCGSSAWFCTVCAAPVAKAQDDYAKVHPKELDHPAQDAQDAKRYRWLRNRHWDTDALCIVTNPKETVRLGTYCPSKEQLDAAIDAAMNKEPK